MPLIVFERPELVRPGIAAEDHHLDPVAGGDENRLLGPRRGERDTVLRDLIHRVAVERELIEAARSGIDHAPTVGLGGMYRDRRLIDSVFRGVGVVWKSTGALA